MELFHEKINKIEALLERQQLLSKEFLTLAETALYLDRSKSSIYKMTSKKEIAFYSPGGKKIYFKRLELDEWISKFRIASYFEISSNVEKYVGKTNSSIS